MSDVYDMLDKAKAPVPTLKSSAKIIDVTPATASQSSSDSSTPPLKTRTTHTRRVMSPLPTPPPLERKAYRSSSTRPSRTAGRVRKHRHKVPSPPPPLDTLNYSDSDWSSTTSASAFSISSHAKVKVASARSKTSDGSAATSAATSAGAAIALAAASTIAAPASKNGVKLIKSIVITGLVIGTVFVILRLWKRIKALQSELDGMRAELDVTSHLTEEDVATIARVKLEEILEQPATSYLPRTQARMRQVPVEMAPSQMIEPQVSLSAPSAGPDVGTAISPPPSMPPTRVTFLDTTHPASATALSPQLLNAASKCVPHVRTPAIRNITQLDTIEETLDEALVAALIWLTARPVTLPCVNCDTGGMFYKCMDGRGAGSVTCEAYRAGNAAIASARKGALTAGEYARELTVFTTKLPEYPSKFAALIISKLMTAAAEVYARMISVSAYLKAKVAEIAKATLTPMYDMWAAFHDAAIKPLIAGMIKYVLQPVTKAMDAIVAFVHLVMKEVDVVLDGGGEIVRKAYDAVYQASGTLSKTIESMLVKIADLIEKLVAGVRGAVNTALDTVVSGVETSVNQIGKGVEKALDGVESGINAAVSGTVGSATAAVNTSTKALDVVVSSTGDKLNTAFTKVTGGVQDSVNAVAGGVQDAVNNVGSNVVGGIGNVIDETEQVVNSLSDGLASSINAMIGVINKNVSSKIEATVNSSATVIEKAVDAGLTPIRSIAKSINKISSFELKLGALGSIYPFMFIPYVREPNGVDLPTVDIPDIPTMTIPHVNIPSVTYKVPSTATKKPQGDARARLLGAIERAQKNWKIASDSQTALGDAPLPAAAPSTRKSYAFMRNNQPTHPHDSEEDFTWATTLLRESIPSTERRPLGISKSIFNKIGDGIKKAANDVADFAEDTAQKAIEEARDLALKAAKPLTDAINKQAVKDKAEADKRAALDSAAAVARENAAKKSLANNAKTQATLKKQLADAKAASAAALKARASAKAAVSSADKVIDGVTLPRVSLTAPTVNLQPPGLKVDWQVKPLDINTPTLQVKMKRPQVNFEVGDISADIPHVPNLLDGVETAIGKLGQLLSDFLKPVWEALGVLFAYMNTVVASVLYFVREEISWAKIRDGVSTIFTSSAVTVKDKMRWLWHEIAVPLMKVVVMIKTRSLSSPRSSSSW
ncbi:hypothetical protein JKP88DRAFT_268649 [Tribonema minus]|uniref:Uncharacterized protein n=1 Tax=Tribonema minus TaxID=303371 RepID=A0A836CG10_9STRA|nr:hypothetical protein JKP88DRAFT_268649 [Tribonema minus]